MKFLINYNFWTPTFEAEKKSVFYKVEDGISTLDLMRRLEELIPFGQTPNHYNIGTLFYRGELIDSMTDLPIRSVFPSTELNVITYEIRTIPAGRRRKVY